MNLPLEAVVARLHGWLLLGEEQNFLTEFGARPEAANCTSEVAGSLLHDAVAHGKTEAVTQLLSAGAAVNLIVKGHGLTPLNQAITADDIPHRVEIVRMLLTHGADPNRNRELIGAINPGRGNEATCLELVQLLVEAGADVNRVYDIYGDPNNTFTALEWAAGMKSIADYLRSKGATDRPDRPPPAPPPAKKRL